MPKMFSPRRYTCALKRAHGKEYCLQECHAADSGVYDYVRVEKPADIPPADPGVVDVAILDMNHGWPNLGHDSLVQVIKDAACDLAGVLASARLRIRVLSYEVRRAHMIPEAPGGRFAVYIGTGGPGHIDPNQNDGNPDGAQGVKEDPAWEPRLFALFDRIRGSDHAALLAVCHSFGVMCRWSGAARPVLRTAAKGGKSAGVQENVLTADAARHPWFSQLADELPGPRHRRVRVVDHRLYDLIPAAGRPAADYTAIGYETLGVDGPMGDAVTMIEWERDRAGVMPRVFAVNHHPEIVDRSRQMLILKQKRERGEVDQDWFEDRARVLTETYSDDAGDQRLHLTSDFTLMGPVRYHLYRQVRKRAEALGRPVDLHEDSVPGSARAPAEGAGVA
jgi:hypothetical protein